MYQPLVTFDQVLDAAMSFATAYSAFILYFLGIVVGIYTVWAVRRVIGAARGGRRR